MDCRTLIKLAVPPLRWAALHCVAGSSPIQQNYRQMKTDGLPSLDKNKRFIFVICRQFHNISFRQTLENAILLCARTRSIKMAVGICTLDERDCPSHCVLNELIVIQEPLGCTPDDMCARIWNAVSGGACGAYLYVEPPPCGYIKKIDRIGELCADQVAAKSPTLELTRAVYRALLRHQAGCLAHKVALDVDASRINYILQTENGCFSDLMYHAGNDQIQDFSSKEERMLAIGLNPNDDYIGIRLRSTPLQEKLTLCCAIALPVIWLHT